MLFVESRVAEQSIGGAARLALMERLQEKGLTPLVRAMRLACYEQALLGLEGVAAMERELAAWTEEEEGSPYVRGDLFCFEEFVLFLIFGEEDAGAAAVGLRAGIIYEAETTEPQKRLEAFCRNVGEVVEALRQSGKLPDDVSEAGEAGEPGEPIEWRPRQHRHSGGEGGAGALSGFTVAVENDTPLVRKETKGEQTRALEVLEDLAARRFLHRLRESHPGGRVAELVSGEEGVEAGSDSLINRLAGVGLLRREMLVSCRKVGRPLFRLPSPEALNVITASNAICSECGASIADEKIEDFIKPTDAAADLLEDGSWLIKRAYAVLRALGLNESQIAVGQTDVDGAGYMLARVCDEPFLFVLRDGDLTLAHARRAFDKLLETGGAHLLVITTGEVQDEARVRLREHARRRARSRSEAEVILVESLDALAGEARAAFERVSQRAVAEELCELDASLGLSAGHLVTARFRFMRNRSGALKDLAESAVGALAGSLRQI